MELYRLAFAQRVFGALDGVVAVVVFVGATFARGKRDAARRRCRLTWLGSGRSASRLLSVRFCPAPCFFAGDSRSCATPLPFAPIQLSCLATCI